MNLSFPMVGHATYLMHMPWANHAQTLGTPFAPLRKQRHVANVFFCTIHWCYGDAIGNAVICCGQNKRFGVSGTWTSRTTSRLVTKHSNFVCCQCRSDTGSGALRGIRLPVRVFFTELELVGTLDLSFHCARLAVYLGLGWGFAFIACDIQSFEGIPMDMAEKETSFRCTWDGDISTFPDYVRKVRLLFEKTRRRKRKHLRPELVAQLTGKAWTITQEVNHERLTSRDGAKYLVEFLEAKLARIPVPDAGSRAEELLVKLRRPTGMSMASWCATVRESYRRLQRALKRARPAESEAVTSPGRSVKSEGSMVPSPSTLGRDRQSPVTDPGDSPSPTSSRRARRSTKETMPEPEQMPTPERPSASARSAGADPTDDDGADDGGAETEELFEDPQTGETSFQRGLQKGLGKGRESSPKSARSRGGKRKATTGSSSSSDEESKSWGLKMWADMDAGLPEVLPTELIGWLMLRRCNLSPQQRLNVLSSTGNSLKADDIEHALRGAEEELRIQEAGHGKGKGGRSFARPNFWVEQSGEWGLLSAEDGEVLEGSMDEVHWIGKDIASVYGMASSTSPSTTSLLSSDDAPRWTATEDGYWFQDDQGQFSYWSQHSDGEYYTMDHAGVYWTWDEWQEEAAWWSATPEQQKEINEAFALYDQKVRTFMESRELMRNKGASRGYYKGKPFGKGKGKGVGKAKSKPALTSGSRSHAVFQNQSQPSEALVAVGQPGYTGCFVCGSKSHDFRSCPQRGPSGKGKPPSSKGGIYMVMSEEEMFAPGASSTARPTSIYDDAMMAQVTHPDLRGHAVLDTGATETVTSLAALEAIHQKRTELLGHDDHVEVVPGPGKVFRFGNGQTQQSEVLFI